MSTSREHRLRLAGYREMLFSNNSHHPGINITVRRGHKWADLHKGDKLLLSSTERGEKSIKAKCVCLFVMPFYKIPASLIKHEHDPSCQTSKGLLAEMKRVYPGFLATEEVIVVLYYITEE